MLTLLLAHGVALAAPLPPALPMRKGQTGTIVAIATDDAYHADEAELLGVTCTANADMNDNGDGWRGGPANCGGRDVYFYKARFAKAGSAVSPGTPAPAPVAGKAITPLKQGESGVLRAFGPEDAYKGSPLEASYIGRTCTAREDLSDNGGWQGGPVVCDGDEAYIYQAQLDKVLGGAKSPAAPRAPTSAGTGLRDGESGRLAEIGPDDAYLSSASQYLGLTCTAKADLSDSGGGWFSGPADCNGQDMYFFQARFAAAQGAQGAQGASDASTPRVGTIVRITAIGDADAYHGDSASIVGKRCAVLEGFSTSSGGGGWFAGPMLCDGSDYYFYQVKTAP
jgi:hypothetical protein